MRRIVRGLLVTLVMVLVMVGCSGASDTIDVSPTPPPTEVGTQVTPPVDDAAAAGGAVADERFPTVVDVKVTATDDIQTWQFAVTLSSEYDSPEQYADAWRVLDADDNELGIRVLTHDHANEQPFTRSGTVTIPEGVDRVFVEGRDLLNGWSGERFELQVLQFDL